MPDGGRVLSVREAAQRLDVPVEMLRRHDLTGRVPEATVVALEA